MELHHYDATGQAELIRTKQISPEELLAATMARIETFDPEVNAVITKFYERAFYQIEQGLPDGPFRGVPFLLKDLGAQLEGTPYYAGTPFLKRMKYLSTETSYFTQRILDAGFLILGKTNTPELGILPTTEPVTYGATRNPYDRSRTTGGSSGGSAAAVSLGMVPVAHANDGGGSIRIPASCCNLWGLKPSRGRISWGPSLAQAAGGVAMEGVVSRTVRDSAALLDVLAGFYNGDPYYTPCTHGTYLQATQKRPAPLRIGFTHQHFTEGGKLENADSECIESVHKTISLLESMGHEVVEHPLRCLHNPEYPARFLAFWATRVAGTLEGYGRLIGRKIQPNDVEILTWALRDLGNMTTGPAAFDNLLWLESVGRQVASYWNEIDVLVTPTLATPPAPLGFCHSDSQNPIRGIFGAGSFAPYTAIFNVTGQPAMSVPTHISEDGLPVGTQLVGAMGREDLLLQLAAALEEELQIRHLDECIR